MSDLLMDDLSFRMFPVRFDLLKFNYWMIEKEGTQVDEFWNGQLYGFEKRQIHRHQKCCVAIKRGRWCLAHEFFITFWGYLSPQRSCFHYLTVH